MNTVIGLLNRLALGTSVSVENELDAAVAALPPSPTDVPNAGDLILLALTDALQSKNARAARCACTVIAAPQVADPSGPILGPILPKLIPAVVNGLREVGPTPDGDTAFALMDVLATVAASSGDARAVVGEAGAIPVLLDTAKAHKSNDDVLFGVTFCLHTLTMMDTLNGKRLLEAGGLQVLVAIFIAEHRRLAKTSVAGAIGITKDGTAAASPAKYAKSAALNTMKVPFDIADEKLRVCNFGKFGDVIAADELKWTLTAERKKSLALLASFRATRGTASRPGSAAGPPASRATGVDAAA